MTSYRLADAEPTESLPLSARPGQFVKLMFVPYPGTDGIPEAMWVQVTSADGDSYSGALWNVPTPGEGLPGFGDRVPFAGRHIIAVEDDRP